MYKMQKIYSVAASLILVVATSNAHATLMNFEVTGYADFWVDEPNDFGLVFNDAITATGTFDDSVLSGGYGTIDFSLASNSLTITVGSATFYESDDDYGTPEMTFTADPLDFELTFYHLMSGGGFFDSYSGLFDAEDAPPGTGNQVNGTWDGESLTITAVPVPAALWLFGSGLIGIAGFARQRKTA
jgi:hypothetical protein